MKRVRFFHEIQKLVSLFLRKRKMGRLLNIWHVPITSVLPDNFICYLSSERAATTSINYYAVGHSVSLLSLLLPHCFQSVLTT